MAHSHSILREGETCCRLAKAKRATVLVDVAAYYQALRDAFLKAQRSIFIVGWDIDSRTRLVGPSGEVDDGMPEKLGAFLTHLVERRPELQVHLLLWDYTMLYALGRELLPGINLDWATPPQVSVCLDDVLPIGACHHQKIVVIDDAVAFSGGIDLTIRRWDTPDHDMHNDKRVEPDAKPYRPFHDIQMLVDGDAALALADIVRKRWQRSACEAPLKVVVGDDPWPDGVEPDFRDVKIGVARTHAAYDGEPDVREVQALYMRAIESAERTIYIENQFLTADRVGECLTRRMQENTELETLIVAPNVHQSWLEEQSMNAGRRRFMKRLEDAGVADRVRLLYPALPDDESGEGVMIHAKAMIVDDRFLQVGSANLNNRSMGLDSECDLALESETSEHSRAIADIRSRLLAEHLGMEPAAVNQAIKEHGSLLAMVDNMSEGPRSLQPIDLSNAPDDELARAVAEVADPERPIEAPDFVGDMFGGEPPARRISRLVKLGAAAFAILGLAAVWRYSPLADLTDPQELTGWLQELGSDYWTPIVILAVYVLGSLVVFPITLLIAATGMMFSPVPAFAYALGGAMLSAVLIYLIGRFTGRNSLRGLIGLRINRISRVLARRGVLSVAALRMLPIAPFTFVNLVAGATNIGLLNFVLGTLAGMTPGILVITLMGNRLARVLGDPQPIQIVWLAMAVLAWLALSVGLQVVAGRLRSGRDG